MSCGVPWKPTAGPTADPEVASPARLTGRTRLIPPVVSTTYAHGDPADANGEPGSAIEPVRVPAGSASE